MVALFELGARRAAHAVRNGEQTAEALAEALLARCAAASPLNAFISLEGDRLRAAARAADQRRQRGERLGPLQGVPLALKEGGSAVAVAARLAPAALGTDTGGSIRVPAALCGITSMRPTTLRWAQAGIVPLSHTRDTAGPMARHVADCVLLDGVITGGPTE